MIDLKDVPQEITSITIGVIGGIAGYFVANGNGWRLFFASAFVGGFAAFSIPPLVVDYLSFYGLMLSQEAKNGLSGVVGAISWQLILTMKQLLPLLKRG